MRKKKSPVRKILSQIVVPDPLYREYPLEYFVGRSVKISFDSSRGISESMWVSVTAVQGRRLIGTLDNEPQVATHLKHGHAVTLSRSQIISVALDKHEWLEEVDIRRAKSVFSIIETGLPMAASSSDSTNLVWDQPRRWPPGETLTSGIYPRTNEAGGGARSAALAKIWPMRIVLSAHLTKNP